jgi:hypothetical protein
LGVFNKVDESACVAFALLALVPRPPGEHLVLVRAEPSHRRGGSAVTGPLRK